MKQGSYTIASEKKCQLSRFLLGLTLVQPLPTDLGPPGRWHPMQQLRHLPALRRQRRERRRLFAAAAAEQGFHGGLPGPGASNNCGGQKSIASDHQNRMRYELMWWDRIWYDNIIQYNTIYIIKFTMLPQADWLTSTNLKPSESNGPNMVPSASPEPWRLVVIHHRRQPRPGRGLGRAQVVRVAAQLRQQQVA